jgi:formimidoylglutamate deiminase
MRRAGLRRDAALDSLIFAGGGPDGLHEVWSAGRHVVRQGHHIRRDAIIAGFMHRMRRLETAI